MPANTTVETVWPPSLSMNTVGIRKNNPLAQQNEPQKQEQQQQQQLPPPSPWGLMENGHGQSQQPGQPKLRGSCDGCQESKLKCSRHRPCHRCADHNIPCIYSAYRRVGRPRKSASSRVSASAAKDSIQFTPTSTTVTSGAASLSPHSTLHNHQANSFGQTFNISSEVNTEQWLPSVQGFNSLSSTVSDSSGWLDFDLGQSGTLDSNVISETMFMQDPSTELAFADFITQDQTNLSSNARRDNIRLTTEQGPPQTSASQPTSNSTDLTPPGSGSRNSSMTSLSDLDVLMSDVAPQLMQNSANSISSYYRQFSPKSHNSGLICQNRCAELLAKQLVVLTAKSAQCTAIDNLLATEKAILPIREAISSCGTCQGNHVVMLMLTVLIEQTVARLEYLADHHRLHGTESFDLAHPVDVEWSSEKVKTVPPYLSKNTSRSPLLLRQYGVDKGAQSDVLKKAFSYSLNRTASHLLALQERVNHSTLMDYNALAARSMAENAYRRTEILRGMVGMLN